jgi:hypothetical protein
MLALNSVFAIFDLDVNYLDHLNASREYLNRLFFHATAAEASPDSIPQWAIKLTASAALIAVSILCVASPKLATRVAVLFTSVKVRIHAPFGPGLS